MQFDTLIIGGGLAGLNAARGLKRAGRDFALLEARNRLGGRIMTQVVAGTHFDMGPAWFWPGQPRMAALVNDCNLTIFEQYASGDSLYEDGQGAPQRGRGMASMEGSYRISGGLAALISAMAKETPSDALLTGQTVSKVTRSGDVITVETTAGQSFTSQQVVLTVPPGIAAARIAFSPALPEAALSAMRATPTWMAGHAKAVAVYDAPFWRDAGLSGDAISRQGPLAEIHDASPDTGGLFALFGFVGVPAPNRRDENTLRDQIIAQLIRLFGPGAGSPQPLILKDWATDPHTATDLDLQPVYAHPRYGHPPALQNLWGGRLCLAGTEVAAEFGGYLEGALGASDHALAKLLTRQV